jgi:hypothetical protein
MKEVVEKYFVCSKCGLTFKTEDECKKHEKICGTVVRVYLLIDIVCCSFTVKMPTFVHPPKEKGVITEDNGYSVYTKNNKKSIALAKDRLINYAFTRLKDTQESLQRLRKQP